MSSANFSRESFSSVDAAWLHMDTPTNLANITGVMSFTTALDFSRLQATFKARLLPYPRFRQCVRESELPLGLPRWEIASDFNLDYHLQQVSLPEPADHTSLQHFVSGLMSHPLDRSRPLWQAYYVAHVSGGSALVACLHHSIGDGIALMQVLLSLADETLDTPWPESPADPPVELSRTARLILPALKAAQSASRTIQLAENVVHEGMEVLIHPARWQSLARVGTAGSRALGKLLLLPPDKQTILKRKCGIEKRAAWSTAIQVEQVKAVGQRMGGTINDILLSAVTGALRRYLDERGEMVHGLNIRAVVPVNLRPVEEVGQLGNRFGLVFLSLPVGIGDPIKRLVVLKKRMNAIKNSPEALVALGILNFIGLTPAQIEKIIVAIFGMKGSAVMTNVPGPLKTLYLAGAPISSIMFWVPSPSNLGLGVSIISYAGQVILGVASDAGMIPDPERIIELFQIEFEHLNQWGRPAVGAQKSPD
ncbi:MAG: wax ester/triacylglycerol synthase family O-acyltransferase [Anaerolineales bacterium]|nr:wax ester/triacylglycerol synthase family O-acyltransferase [Anaerolineales bacterium]